MDRNISGKRTIGRKRIYTSEEEITSANVVDVLQKALEVHKENREQIQKLENYYLGDQEILNRTATEVGEANNQLVLNYAQSIVRDIVGYTFGKDIEYITNNPDRIKDVEALNKSLKYENSSLVDIITATYLSICGVGYQIVLQNEDFKKDTPEIAISMDYLKPEDTFAVHSYAIGNPIMMTCHYITLDTNETIYYVYTNEKEFIITQNENGDFSTTARNHLLLGNPISYFENNQFLIGDFESVMSLLDAINKVSSDSVNDVENFVHSLLVFVNASLGDTKEERDKVIAEIKKNRIIELLSPKGQPSDAKYIASQLNPQSVKELREYLEESLWKIVGLPDRKTRGGGGGDTGDAVKLRDGWADIEVVARHKEKYFTNGKRNVLKVAIGLLQTAGLVSKDIQLYDVEPKFSRNKNDNILVKSQAYSNLINTKTLTPTTCLEVANFTTNISDVAQNGEEYWRKMNIESVERQREMGFVKDGEKKEPLEREKENSEKVKQVGNVPNNFLK